MVVQNRTKTTTIQPEKVIWHLFIGGDLHAFSTLFKGYYAMLHNYGYKISANLNLTEDCLQDFFIYLFENRRNLGEVHNIKAYLFVSFRRAIFKSLKRERRFTDLEGTPEALSKFEFSPEEIAMEQELVSARKEVLAEILNGLSKREREVVYLKYYSDLKTKEISEVMGISYQSVLNTLQKAFVKLRNSVETQVIRQILQR
ncbi:sigma-70 family RNA polymerase sigma factor [Flavobacteriaceae bacterium 3-367]|uniref:RNA polymerase sigma factor n=1 Tax=Eudoraea algarum TaxID=3417568 RepID=UPI00327BFE2C